MPCRTFFLGMLIMSFISCRSNHPWFKSPALFFEGDEIEIYYLKDDIKRYYITKLQNAEYISINKEEAERISSSLFHADNNEGCFFIVRALYSIQGGNYSVTLNKANELLISYRVLAKGNYKNNEDVLLLILKVPPTSVYITSRIIR